MGGGRFSSADYSSFRSAHVDNKSTAQVFSSRSMPEDLDPLKFKDGRRESVDGPDNPNSRPIMLLCDQTGSMGILADKIIRTSLGTIVTSIYERGLPFDPHVAVGGIGDAHNGEAAPMQLSQFEASAKPLLEQLKQIYLEGNGGGNGGESYALAYATAAFQTTFDSWNKRREKGFLFTMGDEPIHGVSGVSYSQTGVTKAEAKRYLGLDWEADMTADDLYALAAERWEVFHIDVKGSEQPSWRKLLGERFIKLTSIDALGETIVSAIQVTLGADAKTVAASWGGDTSLVVAKAISGLPQTQTAGAVARL